MRVASDSRAAPAAARRCVAAAAMPCPSSCWRRASSRSPGLRLRLHRLDDLPVLHQFQGLPELHAHRAARLSSGCGAGPSRAIRRRAGTRRSPTWRSSACSISASALALGLLLAILLDQKIRGEGVLRPIYLYPMALSFIVTGVAWKWFLDPGLGLEQTLHALGLDELPLRLDQEQGPRDLHRGDRRRLAGLGLRHGDVPGRPARHRQRDHQGGADRRRLDRAALPAHHHPDAAAGVPVGLHRARPSGDQVLRPRRGADQRRPRRLGLAAVELHVFDTRSSATRWRSARRAP